MKVKTAEATRAVLDWLVSTCENMHPQVLHVPGQFGILHAAGQFCYSTDWRLAGPIIEREGIDLYCNVATNPTHQDPAWRGSWRTRYCSMGRGGDFSYGETALIAALRCYVASKLGNEVDVPIELMEEATND